MRTGDYRLDFLARRDHVGAYRYAPETVPGFAFLGAPEGRTVTAPNPFSGQGLWIAHGSVNDVACGTTGDETGTENGTGPGNAQAREAGFIESISVMARRGSQSVGFQQECVWRDGNGAALLRDQRTFRWTPGPSQGTVLDVTLRLFAPGQQSVMLGRFDKMLLRLQVASSLTPDGGGQIRNSQGDYGADEINGRSAAWCACVGVVKSGTVGCVLLDHPDNRWHPPRWTVTDSGLIAPQPFAWSALELAPPEPMQLRYRLYVHEDYVDAGWADARLAEFAQEPVRG